MDRTVSSAGEQFNVSKKGVQLPYREGRIGASPEAFCDTDREKLSLSQVCEALSVSEATAKNWVRLGKLMADEDGRLFDKVYIDHLASEIKNGSDSRLKSRRNKKSVSGNAVYRDYIENEENRNTVAGILKDCGHMSEEELRVTIAFFACQLYCQCRGKKVPEGCFPDFLLTSDDCTFRALIADLMGDIDLKRFDYTGIRSVFEKKVTFDSMEDTLGFIYMSLRDLGQRQQTGSYYTSAQTVRKLTDNLFAEKISFDGRTFCDPCCGTGNFLIGLVQKGVDAQNLYGQDIDELSVFITRINMFLRNGEWSWEQLKTHFICGNTLEKTFNGKFSVVLGNPPWGYDFSKEQTTYLLKHYKTAKSKGMESYDLFIEKGLELLEKDGYMAYVLPEALLSVASHERARELILKNASFRFVLYLGNTFSDVQCPAIVLGVRKDGQGMIRQCRVLSGDGEYVIGKDREMGASLFSFHINDRQYDTLKAIEEIQNPEYLTNNNARFALGIVTGNNREYIKASWFEGCETILKGSDILRYSVRGSGSYIRYAPETFQQAAPEEMYRAREKLLYRFISEVPVFAYDGQQTLTLNSCNILIPQIEGTSIKYVLAVLNSSVAAFFMSKKFNSVKLLKSHIEALPIPVAGHRVQEKIVKMADCLMNAPKDPDSLYAEMDEAVFSVYSLSAEHRNTIRAALRGKRTFLK